MSDGGLADAAVTGSAFGAAIMGALALTKLIGSGFSWLLTRTDTKEAALAAKLETRVAELETRDKERAKTERLQENKINALLRGYEIVTLKMRRESPGDPDLLRADQIIAAAFPVDPHTPADMQDQLNRMK